MKAFGVTDIGKVRDSNQDCFAVSVAGAEPVWAVVCDGMGGANGGYYASNTAVGVFSHNLDISFDSLKPKQIENVMCESVISANEVLYKTACEQIDLAGMGTTLVSVLIQGDTAYVVHVGDSRAYMISDQKISRLTVDHSVVQQLIKLGQITEVEAQTHPEKNMITRAVGVKETVIPEFSTFKIKKSDVVLLCSDGLTNLVEDNEIYEIIKGNPLEDAAEKLKELALERGGNDNVTVVLIGQ